MKRRVLLLFCLLAPVAHAQVGGRVTVGTFATRPTTCSAGDLYVTSDKGTGITTPANTLSQSASSTTSCTVSGTVNTSDAITWEEMKRVMPWAELEALKNQGTEAERVKDRSGPFAASKTEPYSEVF